MFKLIIINIVLWVLWVCVCGFTQEVPLPGKCAVGTYSLLVTFPQLSGYQWWQWEKKKSAVFPSAKKLPTLCRHISFFWLSLSRFCLDALSSGYKQQSATKRENRHCNGKKQTDRQTDNSQTLQGWRSEREPESTETLKHTHLNNSFAFELPNRVPVGRSVGSELLTCRKMFAAGGDGWATTIQGPILAPFSAAAAAAKK